MNLSENNKCSRTLSEREVLEPFIFFFPPTGNSRCSIVFVVVATGRFTMVFSMPEGTGKD